MSARPSHDEGRRPAPPWSVWKTVGVVLAALVAVGGLAVMAYVILLFVALSQWGSNK
jgi:hypothetical protein